MCGIFGVIPDKNKPIEREKLKSILRDLFLISQSRGKDASGIALLDRENIYVHKRAYSASKLINSKGYNDLLSSTDRIDALIGHARMETNGTFTVSYNNQPVVSYGCVTIHNGIVVNDAELWRQFPSLKRKYTVDTEVVNALLNHFINKEKKLADGVRKALSYIKGSFAIGTVFERLNYLLLATNTGSLYLIENKRENFLIFVSERFFAEELIKRQFQADETTITKLEPGNAILIEIGSLNKVQFSLSEHNRAKNGRIETVKREIKILDEKGANLLKTPEMIKRNIKNEKEVDKIIREEFEKNKEKIQKLRRCRKCILPETMPYITFDKDGICNYCNNYQQREVRGFSSLKEEIGKYDLAKDKPNCVVSFSGGRDSSYALHYVKKELGLNPLAFSYDWGMLTDLGRRNQARMTGQLGVEHILVSADIQKKREYILKNVSAWLARPHIGMVPLFMAGDKQYFYYLNKVRRETKTKLVIYADNSLEKTDFKYGFADVYLKPEVGKAYNIGKANTMKLLWFYFKQYFSNPRYLNSSLADTFTAYFSSYFVPKEYVYLYKFIPWDEKKIENTLIKEYDWETADDTKSTWRIGDGTAAFYNYIYYTVTGLTENDTFRSNQIRERLISREQGMGLAKSGNEHRVESLLWYANTIGLDIKYAIKTINNMKKLY